MANAEQTTPSRRRLSVVSFISAEKAPMKVEQKLSRRVGIVVSPDPRSKSAVSNYSTVSTWNPTRQPASSIVALRSRIMITIDKCLSLIGSFDETYLHNVDEDFSGIYQEFVRQLLARIGYKNDLFNCEQLDSVIMQKFQDEESVAQRSDYRSLAIVCARSKAFHELCNQVRVRLDEVYEYADTFCVTFSQESEGLSFESLETYENTKTDCLKEIHLNSVAVQTSLNELKEVVPLAMYLDQYSRVIHYIEHVVRCLRCVATNLKRWIVADEQYEKALEKEIYYLRQRSAKMSSARLTVSNLRYEVKARTPSAMGRLRKTELNLDKSRNVIQKLKQKQLSLDRILEENLKNQHKIKQEISHIERQAVRKQNSSDFNTLTPNVDKLRLNLQSLQAHEEMVLSYQASNNQEIATVTKEMHELEADISKRKTCMDRTTERAQEHSVMLRKHESASHDLTHKLQVLRKLQSLKKDPSTIRKMEFRVINIDYKEAMLAAIHRVACRVGANWPEIYMKLTFMPQRDEKAKKEDIEAMQKTQITSGRSDYEQAVIAFERWAKKSMAANINELIYASKHLIDQSVRKESAKKSKYAVPRAKKRFQNLQAKTNVIYV